MALDFLILYEHTVREYESDLLLKLELERRGYTAEIRQLLDPKHLRLFGKDKPEVLVASCMYDNEAINSHVYNNIGRCNKIVNLHWEQMLSDTQEEGDWFNMNGNAKRCVQTCWGKRTAARLQAHKSGRGARYTRARGVAAFAYVERCADKRSALRREAALKKLPKAQKELLCRAWSAAGGPFSGA